MNGETAALVAPPCSIIYYCTTTRFARVALRNTKKLDAVRLGDFSTNSCYILQIYSNLLLR